MSSIFDGIDMSDPCAVWPKLQQVCDRLLAGEMVVKARFGDDEREWQRGNLSELRKRIIELKAECARKNGAPPVRRAFRYG
ncbi:hypothetical protein [Cohaesibacter marisflavi]|uniref:hypothetical protein n=1 Tax=Cohaesibacter marisflavi TaxID=655353 RepID=UPI0029C65FEA|nr:hypothetical protein [Cohaesibacter marisflavi]